MNISNESRVFSIVRLENMNFGMLEFKLDGSNNGNAAKGSLTMKMVAAGSAHAAQEWLIYESAQSTQDTDSIVKSFGKDKKVDKLGDVAFKDGGTLRFVRDNIAVCIQADGDYVKKLDDFTANIDMAVLNTPELKYMPAARRILKPGELAKQKDADGNDVYSYKFTAAPAGCEMIHLDAAVDGEEIPILLNIVDNLNGKQINLGRRKGEVKIKITAVTYNLMVDVMETTVTVPGDEKPAAN